MRPDGQWVGFFLGGSLKKVSIHGGVPVTLCGAEFPTGVNWESDDSIFFGQSEGILKVSAADGTPETVIPAEPAYRLFGPQLLPGGKALMFTHYLPGALDDGRIVVVLLESGQRKLLLEGGRDARYVPTGHLVYAREGTLMAVPFDVDRLEVTGGPASIVEDIASSFRGAVYFSFSDTGALVYRDDPSRVERTRSCGWTAMEGPRPFWSRDATTNAPASRRMAGGSP